MVRPGLAVDLLLQTRQRTERLNPPVAQVELPLGDVSGVVRHRVGDVVARHRGHRQNRDRTGAVEVHRLLVAAGQLAVEIARITAGRRNLLHRNRDLLERVGEVGHVGQETEHPLALERVLFGDREAHIRHHQALHDRVRRGVDEHHRARQRAVFVERALEGEVVVVLDPHAAEDDHIDLRLQGDAGEQFVVGFARDREDRQLLRFDQRVEDVDHRDVRADHVPRNDTLGRVDRRTADVNHVGEHFGPVVPRGAAAGEHTPEQRLGAGNLHRTAEETDLVAGADAAASGEDLQRHLAVGKADHLRQRNAARTGHFSKFVVGDVIGFDGDDVAGDMDDFVIYFTHLPYSVRRFWLRFRPPAS